MIDSSIAGRILVEFGRRARDRQDQDLLELILQLVAQGATNKDIAEELFISEYTVRNSLSIIFQKLHVNSRTEAAAYAVQKGLVEAWS